MSSDSWFLPDDVLFGSTPWSMKNLSKLIPNLSLQLLFCLSQHLHEIFLCCYLFRVYTLKRVSKTSFVLNGWKMALLRYENRHECLWFSTIYIRMALKQIQDFDKIRMDTLPKSQEELSRWILAIGPRVRLLHHHHLVASKDKYISYDLLIPIFKMMLLVLHSSIRKREPLKLPASIRKPPDPE